MSMSFSTRLTDDVSMAVDQVHDFQVSDYVDLESYYMDGCKTPRQHAGTLATSRNNATPTSSDSESLSYSNSVNPWIVQRHFGARRRSPSASSVTYLEECLDTMPAYLFARALTPTASSRSPSPLSSSASVIVDVTSPPIAKVIENVRQNMQREFDQRLEEMEYRLMREYADRNRQQEYDKAEKDFGSTLRERMAEVVKQYDTYCEENRREYEELLQKRFDELESERMDFEALLRERMAEVQAQCNEMLKEKDEDITKLRARLKAATNKNNPVKQASSVKKEKRPLRNRIMSESEDQHSDAETSKDGLYALSPTPPPTSTPIVNNLDASNPPLLKDAPIDGPNGLRELFFKLQLSASIEYWNLQDAQKELKLCREKLDRCQCELQPPALRHHQPLSRGSLALRLPYHAHDSKLPPTPTSPLRKPFQFSTPSPSPNRNRNLRSISPVTSGAVSVAGHVGSQAVAMSEEEEVDELQDDTDSDEPWEVFQYQH